MMGVTKLLEKLRVGLKKGEARSNQKRCSQIEQILKKLKAKQRALKKKQLGEKDKTQRKELDLETRIVARQRKKGIIRLKELRKKCK